jgi:hypothetical protein
MLDSYTWLDFSLFLLVLLVVYVVYVAIFNFRNRSSAEENLIKPVKTEGSFGADLMGVALQDQHAATNGGKQVGGKSVGTVVGGVCGTCGRPVGESSSSRTSMAMDVVTRDDNAEGTIDLDDLEDIIAQTSAIQEGAEQGQDAQQLTLAKMDLAGILAADAHIGSTDFARQVATTIDHKAPTDFSVVESIERLAA